jgi:AmmeMemoRadiSam system protein B/AmmeMemoRadiSam system protein A
MNRSRYVLPFLLSFSLAVATCMSQNEQTDRQPAVARQFYPAQKDELTLTLKKLFAKAVPSKRLKNVVAIVSPHAGYDYSGVVAASSFNQIDPSKKYENIFVLGPSHHVAFEGASVYSIGDFITPLGRLHVNREIAKDLTAKSKVFTARTDAHTYEHSVKVQLPFLQYIMKREYKIVPIVVGASTPETCEEIASALRPYFNTKNLFVISTDFSHYPAYADAKQVDKATADAVLSNSVKNLIRTVNANAGKGVPNLVTSMCGWPCVVTLLYLTQNNPEISMQVIQYKNSGDAEIGDKERVVGYYAIMVSLRPGSEPSGFKLLEKDKNDLLGIARRAIEQYVRHQHVADLDTVDFSDALKTRCGAFVTLNEHNTLRGCIGHFGSDLPLFRVVQEMAIAAAVKDTRFSPVSPEELDKLEIEISVLTPMRRITSIDDIAMGKHGIYIKKGSSGGTFLPQVAAETGWSKEEFLGHCAQDKAGIGWYGWKDAEIYIYEALVFSEKGKGI